MTGSNRDEAKYFFFLTDPKKLNSMTTNYQIFFFLSDNLITNTGYHTSIAIASILYHMGLMILLATGKKMAHTCKYCTAVCDMSND